jgi:uncharacterized protein (TIRG00374 family)
MTDPEPNELMLNADATGRSRRRVLIEYGLMAAILLFIFGWLLPQFIDYQQVFDAMAQLTLVQVLLLAVIGVARTWLEAAVYTTLIPGLGWWAGYKAWLASNTASFVLPPPGDLIVRFAMYRSVGVEGLAAIGSGVIVSWFFTTGLKLIIPALALAFTLLDGTEDETITTLAIVAVAAVVGAAALVFIVVRAEKIAYRMGNALGRGYNRLARRFDKDEIEDFGSTVLEFRGQMLGSLRGNWLKPTLATVLNQAVFFLMLVLSMRFMGVTAEEAPWEIIFDAYAVGLLLYFIPIIPGGIGVVEFAYVQIIAPSGGDLANQVAAGAFVHRIFTWLLPILMGLIPLAAWRRSSRSSQDASAS